MKKALLIISLLLLPFISIVAQVRSISGTVVSAEDKLPIPGATVVVEGTSIGTSTNNEGKYSLSVPAGTEALTFSFVGMKPQVVPIEGRSVINVELEEQSLEIDEVVAIGYGIQKKSDLTGAVSSISAEEISELPVMSVDQAMQGKVAGVQITQNSGAPGSDVMIRVRGIGTVNNSNPLYVIDGLATSSMNFLNPSDIKSIEVLKDASATAIYGSRGANGVIIITTKMGEKGRSEITFDAYNGIQETWRTLDMMNAEQYATIMGKDLSDPQYNTYDTDWQNEIFQVAPMQNYHMSVLGGTEKSNYSITGGYYQQEGIIKGSDFERYTFRVNSSHQVNDRIKIGEHIAFTSQTKNSIPENNEYESVLNHAIGMAPYDPVYLEDGSLAPSTANNLENPVGMIKHTNDTYKSNRVVGNVFADIEIIDNLHFKSDFGVDISYGDFFMFIPEYNIAPDDQNLINVVIRNSEKWNNWQWENTLTYRNTFNEVHDITVLAGITAQESEYNNVYASKSNTPTNDPNFWYIDSATEDPTAGGGAWESSNASYLGRIIYNYASKYMLTASFRADGSSKFGPGKRYGYFPSASVGWKISEEPFFDPFTLYVDILKLRAGYGQVGNQDIGLYAYQTPIKGLQNYVLGVNQEMVAGRAPFSVGNPNLQWETAEQLNVGFDLYALGNKISLTVDYYNKKTRDMLLRTPSAGIFGNVEYPWTNAGELVNKGWEFSLNYREQRNEFKYDVGVNFSTVTNEVLSLGNGGEAIYSGMFRGSFISKTEVGEPVASFYGLVTDGIFQNKYEVEEYVNSEGEIIQPFAQPGDFRFVDQNDDGTIDEEDKTYIGSPIPDFTYGFSFSASYKFIDFSMFFQGVYGNEIFNGNKYYTEGTGYYNLSADMVNSWDGENTSNELPNIDGSSNNLSLSSRYIEDGSYLRLKNIQLGFTLPKDLSDRLSVRKARLYVGATNLLTFTQYEGFDPEIGASGNLDIGIDRGTYPQPRTYLIGLNLQF